jgi:hypothetical protein
MPRKCNTSIYINKIHCWLQERQGKKRKGDMIPQERGLEGLGIYFIFYLPILC